MKSRTRWTIITASAGALLAFPAFGSAWSDLPCGATEETAHVCLAGELARDGTVPVPLALPAPVALPLVLTPSPGSADVEPLPRLVTLPRSGRLAKPQRPRCALGKAGVRWYVRRGCDIPRRLLVKPRAWAVTGERKAQGPSPAAIVSRLLVQVPALAGDTPYASSILQGAGGRSASGAVSARERGRLVPANIPGHPWTSRSTSPRRGVAVSVSWRSGRLTVSVLYSASRGRSSTSVTVR